MVKTTHSFKKLEPLPFVKDTSGNVVLKQDILRFLDFDNPFTKSRREILRRAFRIGMIDVSEIVAKTGLEDEVITILCQWNSAQISEWKDGLVNYRQNMRRHLMMDSQIYRRFLKVTEDDHKLSSDDLAFVAAALHEKKIQVDHVRDYFGCSMREAVSVTADPAYAFYRLTMR